MHRYGPQGSYWAEHPGTRKLPIRMWQIWNEPNFNYYWRQPWASSYVKLLAAAHAAIKAADPGAKVVLAGFPNLAWDCLDTVYKIKGARNDFEIAAAHPYTQQPANVIRFLQFVRDGDAQPRGLPASRCWSPRRGGTPPTATSPRTTSAARPTSAARRRASRRSCRCWRPTARSSGCWRSTSTRGPETSTTGAPSFNFAGLFDDVNGRLRAKPVYSVFRQGVLALERCRRTGSTAGHCVQRIR